MNGKRKILIFTVLGLLVISIAAVGGYYWYENTYYVRTDDSRVSADLFKVSPQISGRLLEFNVNEGDTVSRNQVLGRQEMVNMPESSLDLSVIKAPVEGTVIKKSANIGETVVPGQPLAMVADLKKVYVSANVEETKLGLVKPGQKAEITVDSFPGVQFTGEVESIGQATASTFSIIPTSSSGNFTKVIQRIPVKIRIDGPGNKALLPGMNTEVKIHVR